MTITGKYEASNFFRKRGVIIDLNNSCYKTFDKILSFIPFYSACNKIPQVEYVLVFKTMYLKCESCSVEDFQNDKSSTYQLSLVYNKNRRLIVEESNNKQEIFEKARIMAEQFKVKIRDSATNRSKPEWITV